MQWGWVGGNRVEQWTDGQRQFERISRLPRTRRQQHGAQGR